MMRPETRNRALLQATAVLMVLAHAGLVLWNIRANALVVDEPYHIASGLSHYTVGNFRADQVNPPLARMISVLPLLVHPPLFDESLISDDPGARSEWAIGFSWVDLNGPAVVEQTRLARLAGIAWSVLGAWLLYGLARRHGGTSAAMLALAMWCFDPTIIALAAVVTADLPSAVAALGAASAFETLLASESPRALWTRRVLAGACLGAALLVKFTLLVLPLFWLVWALGRWAARRDARPGLGRPLTSWLVVVAIAVAVVNAGYGFTGSFQRLEDYRFVSSTFAGPLPEYNGRVLLGESGNRFRGTPLGKLPVPLPEDFVLGVDVQRRDFEHPMPSYLNGRWSRHGWWWFYIYAMQLKEPLPLLILITWAAARCAARLAAGAGLGGVGWLAGLGLYLFAFVSAQVGFSHHLRYVLPSYPFLFLFVACLVAPSGGTPGSVAPPGQAKSGVRLGPGPLVRWLLVLWLAWVAVSSSPYSLSYFNGLVGGPDRGHLYLAHSNVDWGQGLLQLRRWIEDHPEARPLHVSYAGATKPETLGIMAPPVPPYPPRRRDRQDGWPAEHTPEPGFYAISASMLHSPHNEDYRYLLRHEPIVSLGGTIFIYRFEAR